MEIPAEHLSQGQQVAFYRRSAPANDEDQPSALIAPTDVSYGVRMRGSYAPLADHLIGLAWSTEQLSFAQLERILGRPLPASARRHRAWWANNSEDTHSHARSWMGVGWLVDTVDLNGGNCSVQARPSMTLSPAAQHIVATLGCSENAVEPRRFLRDRTSVDKPGMYAWWGDDEARTVLSEEIATELPPLLYVGQAGATKWPSGKRSSATLKSRVGGTLQAIREYEFSVPGPDELGRILDEAERCLSIVDVCEGTASGLARPAALRRSVLKAAFDGELVPQDPADEPASVLLDRIRVQHATAPRKRRARATA